MKEDDPSAKMQLPRSTFHLVYVENLSGWLATVLLRDGISLSFLFWARLVVVNNVKLILGFLIVVNHILVSLDTAR